MNYGLYDVPDVLSGVAELAASDTGRQRVIADGNRVVLVLIGEVVRALCHCADEDAYALSRPQILNIVAYPHDRRVEGKGDFAAVWW